MNTAAFEQSLTDRELEGLAVDFAQAAADNQLPDVDQDGARFETFLPWARACVIAEADELADRPALRAFCGFLIRSGRGIFTNVLPEEKATYEMLRRAVIAETQRFGSPGPLRQP